MEWIFTLTKLGFTPTAIILLIFVYMIGVHMGILPKWNGKKNGNGQDRIEALQTEVKLLKDNHLEHMDKKLDLIVHSTDKNTLLLENIRDSLRDLLKR